jgi:hypothetical protein
MIAAKISGDGNLLVIQEHRRVPDTGNFDQLGAWSVFAHLLPGFASQQVGFSPAHDEGRTFDQPIERPKVDVLIGKACLEEAAICGS